MNCSIMPLNVRFHSLSRVEKHSAHVACPPSFSARIRYTSSSYCSVTAASSIGAELSSAITRRASSVRPVPIK
jgi:hypothetical protein